jgi:probable HAF family extracellular repeat protein
MESLGTIGPVPFGDGNPNGGTAEDRFFGWVDPDGILAIRIPSGVFEVDHLQYGLAAIVPEPGSFVLVGIGVAACWLLNRRRPHFLISVVALWLTGWCASTGSAGPFFMGLGDLPGGGFSSFAYGVSSDGSIVVGQGLSASGAEAFRWTQGGGMVGLGALPSGTFSSLAFETSVDGAVVVGKSGADAFRWTHGGGMQVLPPFPYGSSAYGVSADGSVVVGTGYVFPGGIRPPRPPETEAFRWTQDEGLVRLGDLPGGLRRGNASDVSADGMVIVGYGNSASGTEAFHWTQANGMIGLGDLSGGGFSSIASSVSADGSAIVGYGSSATGTEAFRWTQGGGMVGLGILPGFVSSRADDVSADGSVVIGWGHSASDTAAFLWDATHGIRNLRDVLVNDFGLGTNLDGWNLGYARGVSADGQVVVGYGTNPNGNTEAWIARLATEPMSKGDFNSDGTVDAADYVVWRKNFSDDPTKYDEWRDNFGRTLSAGSGSALPSAAPLSAAVPEPATWLLLLLSAAAPLLGYRSSRKKRWPNLLVDKSILLCYAMPTLDSRRFVP